MWTNRIYLMGNTPTSVGKTEKTAQEVDHKWKHPHERGEDASALSIALVKSETPPRAWGRLPWSLDEYEQSRNTPTSVGKTRKSGCAACRV